MRRKRLIALLGAGIMAANLIAPGSISVVQASEVETEQIYLHMKKYKDIRDSGRRDKYWKSCV